MFKEFKEKVNSKVEEMRTMKEESEMRTETKEKKNMPKWAKIALGVAGGAVALGAAFVLGKHTGNDDDVEEDFDEFGIEEDFELDIDSEEEN